MKNIILLSGGNSSEREISLKTGKEIEKALIEIGYNCFNLDPAEYNSTPEFINDIQEKAPEIVFFGLHGGDGEDGSIQTLLELNGIKYTGSGPLASKIAMDKYFSKLIAKDLDIPVPKFIYLSKDDNFDINEISFGFPLIVKPNNGGSSVGISIVKDENDIYSAIQEAFKYDSKILIEEYIPGKELTVTILGDTAYPVVEIKPVDGWYDFKNKYTSGNTQYICPAQITIQEAKLVSEHAANYYKRLGLKAYARIDFRYDGNKFYFLEANTLPGMTSLSLTPMSVKAEGIDFVNLINKIITFSLEETI